MSAWHISNMTDADLNRVLEIERSSFSTPWNSRLFQDELACEGSHNFLAFHYDHNEHKEVIGYITFRIIFDEMHIFKIAVDPTFRGKGLASWLLNKCFETAIKSGALVAFLEVRQSNKVAINFYKKLGFNIVSTRFNYYSENKEDALVMMKKLKGEL